MSEPDATYDPNLLTDLDKMRFKVADHVEGAYLRPDAEYLALLAMHGDWRLATADMAESLASQYAQEPDSFTATGDMSVSWKERVKQWQWLATQMRNEVAAEAAAETVLAYGLISVAPTRLDPNRQPAEYRDPFLRTTSRRI